MSIDLTVKRLKELLHYDPETGIFTQKLSRKGSGLIVGENSGCLSPQGYILIGIDYKRYRAHRLAFLWMTGKIPKEIDHINGNRSDNRWINLRVANRSFNMANAKRYKINTTGLKGVSKHRSGKWQAGITKDYVRRHLGLFDTPELAHNAYCVAAEQYFGEFARSE